MKRVSNVFCPAYAAVSASGGEITDTGFRFPAGKHTIFVAFGHPSLNASPKSVMDSAKRAARIGYDSLKAAHIQWWRRFWNQAYISIPDKRIEQMWYRSQYYLASCLPRRVKSFSPEGAYGDFPGLAGYHPQDSVYHLFAALSSNHPDLCKGQIEYLLDTLPVAKLVAKHVYFLDGARYPWHATPGLLPYLPGHTNDGYYLHEHHVNGWIAEFVRRYLSAYGWDRRLVRRYYPILAEIARFFSSMITSRGDGFEIVYVPSAGQEETNRDLNQKNIFDMLVSAKWTLTLAADVSARLGAQRTEAERWRRQADGLSLGYCLRENSIFGSFEGDTGHTEKVPSQLTGIVMATLFSRHRLEFLNTYEYLKRNVDVEACAWNPGYFAIAAARLRRAEDALAWVQRAFEFSAPPWILFVENTQQVPGRLPYYLAAHALFVQAINEMLLQDWSGKVELFPACPFREASFKLRGNERVIEARKIGDKIEVLSDISEPLP